MTTCQVFISSTLVVEGWGWGCCDECDRLVGWIGCCNDGLKLFGIKEYDDMVKKDIEDEEMSGRKKTRAPRSLLK